MKNIRNIGVLTITEDLFKEVFHLRKEDIRILNIEYNPYRNTIKILLEGDKLPRVAEGCEPPNIYFDYIKLDEESLGRIDWGFGIGDKE